MPENAGTPESAQNQPGTPDTASNQPDATTETENLKARNKVLEELLRQANGVLDGHGSIFPGSHLHEDIHLAVTGQRL